MPHVLGVTCPWAFQVDMSPNLEPEVGAGGVTPRKDRSCENGPASKERTGSGRGVSLVSEWEAVSGHFVEKPLSQILVLEKDIHATVEGGLE